MLKLSISYWDFRVGKWHLSLWHEKKRERSFSHGVPATCDCSHEAEDFPSMETPEMKALRERGFKRINDPRDPNNAPMENIVSGLEAK